MIITSLKTNSQDMKERQCISWRK